MRKRNFLLLIFIGGLLVGGCSSKDEQAPTPWPSWVSTNAIAPTRNVQQGGEPRTKGYWQLWNSCAPDNRSETAAANGGRTTGWFIMDDLLQNPGILMGTLKLQTCQEGLNLLHEQSLDGTDRSSDKAYALASQLLAAQLNLAARAEYCSASDEAVQTGQLLLLSMGFDGIGSYLEPGLNSQDHQTAAILIEQLASYNAGNLCQ